MAGRLMLWLTASQTRSSEWQTHISTAGMIYSATCRDRSHLSSWCCCCRWPADAVVDSLPDLLQRATALQILSFVRAGCGVCWLLCLHGWCMILHCSILHVMHCQMQTLAGSLPVLGMHQGICLPSMPCR